MMTFVMLNEWNNETGDTHSARKRVGHLSGSAIVWIQAHPPHHVASQPLPQLCNPWSPVSP